VSKHIYQHNQLNPTDCNYRKHAVHIDGFYYYTNVPKSRSMARHWQRSPGQGCPAVAVWRDWPLVSPVPTAVKRHSYYNVHTIPAFYHSNVHQADNTTCNTKSDTRLVKTLHYHWKLTIIVQFTLYCFIACKRDDVLGDQIQPILNN